MNQLIPVPFYDDTLVLVNDDNLPFVAMKPIVENIGLDWKSQYAKLTDKFAPVVVIITTTGGDGKRYEMVCLPLRKLPAWMYSIHPNKVKPELREKITQYQEECDEALWNYWTKGTAIRKGSLSVPQILAAQREARKLMSELKKETNPAIRRTYHAQLQQTCRLQGIEAPSLEEIGRNAELKGEKQTSLPI